MQRTPPKNRMSFVDVPLPLSPGESGGRYPAPREDRPPSRLSDAEAGAIETVLEITERMSDDEVDSVLTRMMIATKARRAASRKLYMEKLVETPVMDYNFEDEVASPLECDASFCPTDSLVETVKRRPKKRGISTSPEIIQVTAVVHPAPEKRGVRAGVAQDTPKRRKTGLKTNADLDAIEMIDDGVRARLFLRQRRYHPSCCETVPVGSKLALRSSVGDSK